MRVRYLEPLHPPYETGLRRDIVRDLAEQVRNAFVAELAQMRAERNYPRVGDEGEREKLNDFN